MDQIAIKVQRMIDAYPKHYTKIVDACSGDYKICLTFVSRLLADFLIDIPQPQHEKVIAAVIQHTQDLIEGKKG
jgi:hypothetical protein